MNRFKKTSNRHHGILSKLLESRRKEELEVRRVHQQNDEAIGNDHQRVRVECLVTSCMDAMIKAIKRRDQLLLLTLKADNSAFVLKQQETWLNVRTKVDDEVLKQARQHFNSLTATDKSSQSSYRTRKKTVSNRSCDSAKSETSSKINKELLFAKHPT